MARKISELAARAFVGNTLFKSGNTKVIPDEVITRLLLHGNTIAKKQGGIMQITSAGWRTITTKERLNALPNVSIRHVKGEWFLNGALWDGSWITV